jgi:hypothetical protein
LLRQSTRPLRCARILIENNRHGTAREAYSVEDQAYAAATLTISPRPQLCSAKVAAAQRHSKLDSGARHKPSKARRHNALDKAKGVRFWQQYHFLLQLTDCERHSVSQVAAVSSELHNDTEPENVNEILVRGHRVLCDGKHHTDVRSQQRRAHNAQGWVVLRVLPEAIAIVRNHARYRKLACFVVISIGRQHNDTPSGARIVPANLGNPARNSYQAFELTFWGICPRPNSQFGPFLLYRVCVRRETLICFVHVVEALPAAGVGLVNERADAKANSAIGCLHGAHQMR